MRLEKKNIIALLIALTMLSVFLYLIVRMSLFLATDYRWYEKTLAFFLLLAEFFTMLHAFGYFLNLYHVTMRPARRKFRAEEAPELKDYPPVAILVPAYREPIDVVTDTLICFYNLTYPNKHIYFLDDTRYDLPGQDEQAMREYRRQIDDMCRDIGVSLFRRKWRGAKAGIINDFLDFLAGREKPGFEFTRFEERPYREVEKYVIVFDADMNPMPDFVRPLVAYMEENLRLAFIQTPQYYTNFETNRVAKAAGLQQAVFYEYICEGKSFQDAMFCCGTNVIFRREALEDVGGFDESSVTEDFATSLRFHACNWSSAYMNHVSAFGLGPEDMGAYFKQQFRWALGTVGLFRTIIGLFLRNPKLLPAAKWWEYFLSGTHYFIGWVMSIMMICPVLFLVLDVPSYFARADIFFLFFFPYIVLTVAVFVFSMSQRRYRLKELAIGIILQALCFPVYMKASLLGFLGFRGKFGITPKGRSLSLPLTAFMPQLVMALLCFGAAVFGGLRLWYEDSQRTAVFINSMWCLYHFALLSMFLYFNQPEGK